MKPQHWEPWSVLSDTSLPFLIIKTLVNSHIYVRHLKLFYLEMLPVFTAKIQSNDMKLSREKNPQAEGQEKLPNTHAMNSLLREGIEIQI